MTELCEIMARHGSDKSPLFVGNGRRSHDYTPLYHEWFSKWRDQTLEILECGVYEGASLRGWVEYFPFCRATALDIKPDRLFMDTRIACFQCDQKDRGRIKLLLNHYCGAFKIIIDDGLHKPEGSIPFFQAAYPYLAEGGYYIIEDVRPDHLEETLSAVRGIAPHAEVHDLRYEGSKYDNILITVKN